MDSPERILNRAMAVLNHNGLYDYPGADVEGDQPKIIFDSEQHAWEAYPYLNREGLGPCVEDNVILINPE